MLKSLIHGVASRSRNKGCLSAAALLHVPIHGTRPFGTTNNGNNNSNNGTTNGDAHKSVYITNVDSDTSNAPLLIGFMDYFLRHIPSIGFFQPIGFSPPPGSHTVAPSHADLLYSAFPLKGSPTGSVGVTQQGESGGHNTTNNTSYNTYPIWSSSSLPLVNITSITICHHVHRSSYTTCSRASGGPDGRYISGV